MRTRKKKWTARELETNGLILSGAQGNKGRWRELFGNGGEVHVEIGCGKGRFITGIAERNGALNYIAIEREPDVIVVAARAAREKGLQNIRFIVCDVKDLTEYFETGEIGRLYVNFCDPWPNKKKWRKRRLTYVDFLRMYRKLLRKDGGIHFKTDNMELFEFSINQFSEEGYLLRNISLDLHNSVYGAEENIMTEYEEKFSKNGGRIYRLEAYANV